ncbi:unnamed protein product [Effrenium voratum]|uniref:Pseudouridine synthase RsuA/RluA-like domain-containing protein n=1 Tax=Effrenium voratum TaxID=2562239 RepID=A0AA36J253_9DINO|nr:unnamed protein product [Effrenium voratum]
MRSDRGDALRVLRDVKRGARVENVQCSKLLSRCQKSGDWGLGLDAFRAFQRASLRADVVTFTCAIKCCEKGKWRSVLGFLARMGAERVPANAKSADACVNSCGGEWQRSAQLLASWCRRGLRLDSVLCHSLADAARGDESRRDDEDGKDSWRQGLHVLRRMAAAALRGDAFTRCVGMKASDWRRGFLLLEDHPVVLRAALARSPWSRAGALMARLDMVSAGQRLAPHGASFSSAISACREMPQGWQRALWLLAQAAEAEAASFVPRAAALGCCEAQLRWREAAELLTDPDPSTLRSALAACGANWVAALAMLMGAKAAARGVEGWRALLWSCEAASAWPAAVALIERAERSEVDEPCALSAIRSCGKCLAQSAGLGLLWRLESDAGRSQQREDVCFLPCALAALLVEDPAVIHGALAECARALPHAAPAKSKTSRELFPLLWATATLGASSAHFAQRVWGVLGSSLGAFSGEELVLLAWGAAAARDAGAGAGGFFPAIQEEVQRRASSEPTELLAHAWAAHFAQRLPSGFLAWLRCQLQRLGRARDGPSQRGCGRLAGAEPEGEGLAAVLQLPDCLVLNKEAGWEVCDQHGARQVVDLLRSKLGWQHPILWDAEQQFGFLHRLDVPSSGLLLAATSYERYYELQLQLRTGSMTRDYAILSHGWWPSNRRSIHASVYWGERTLCRAGGRGKPSVTLPKVLGHLAQRGECFSFLVARILTGRRHQIRTHFAHVGHPVVADHQYTARSTRRRDQELLDRHFLHRFHLAFEGSALKEPLPAELRRLLRRLEPVRPRELQWSLGSWEEVLALGDERELRGWKD